jgi:hypothetical protein
MAETAPKIDSRTAKEISRQVLDLLRIYAPEWNEIDSNTGRPKGASAALIGIFARYCELIIQRLNKVPEKNVLAFLNYVGESVLPPQPARVPLTFSLAAGSPEDAVVRAGTQVAAPPGEGEEVPVIYETEQELTVTAAKLDSIFVRDPEQDMYTDCSPLIASSAPTGVPAFQGGRRIEHILYIGDGDLFGYPHVKALRVIFQLSKKLGNRAKLEWQIRDGGDWRNRDPAKPSGLGKTGKNTVAFGPFSALDVHSVNATASRWLRCKLTTPITPSAEAVAGKVRKSELPRVNRISVEVDLKRPDGPDVPSLRPELAFANGTPVDPSKGFSPFGAEPRRDDVLYLASAEAFSTARNPHTRVSATVDLDIRMAISHLRPSPTSVRPSADLELAWECWNGAEWQRVGTSAPPSWLDPIDLDPLPGVMSESRVVLQGTAQEGTRVQIDKTTVAFGDDRRFSAPLALTPALNVIAVSATHRARKRKSTTWVVIHLGKQEDERVHLGVGELPDDLETKENEPLDFTLKVAVSGNERGTVKKIRVTNGANDFSAEAAVRANAAAVPIKLMAGRNSLLIEGLVSREERRAASTVTIGCRAKAPAADKNGFSDGTFAFCQSGTVGLNLPESVGRKAVHGEENHWLRVRLAKGDYGRNAGYRIIDPKDPKAGFILVPATFRPPVFASLEIGYEKHVTASPRHCLSYNNKQYEDCTSAGRTGDSPFEPFQPAPEDPPKPTLYFGFSLPPDRKGFPNRTIGLYNRLIDFVYEAGSQVPSRQRPEIAWEYWNGTGWVEVRVRDGTEGFTRSGLVEFLAPSDFTARGEFGLSRYWLRVRRSAGEHSLEPRLRRVLANTTMAEQTVSVTGEPLGSSDGSKNQQFRTVKTPVLPGQQLQIREPERPASEEQAVLEREEGKDAIIEKIDEQTGRPRETWVRWHEVPDFFGSGSRDRHYVVNHITGEISFGDGLRGLVPPAGIGNIRMARYRTGGGEVGNRPENTITQLKTTIPYVDAVTNAESASGGAEAEPLESLVRRAPRTLRHRGRAVTVEDYEDLAMLASPRVARAKCVPLRDLASDPDGVNPRPGKLSLIIVPRSKDSKPTPTIELIGRVQAYVDERRIATADLVIVGPEYVRVAVEAEIAVETLEGANDVRHQVIETLSRFLHPLTGGLSGEGWDFGRKPYRSDLFALIEAIPGVDHVGTLKVQEIEDRPGSGATGRALVYSGTHTIRLTYVET